MFEFDSRNVGKPMTKIRIGHDGTGFGAGWHLAKVVVENLATGESVTFECNRWVKLWGVTFEMWMVQPSVGQSCKGGDGCVDVG